MKIAARPLSAAILALPLLLTVCISARAASIDESLPDPQTLSQLELHAQQAPPREQCFLYAQLVHTMTELAARQFRDGEVDHASTTLKKVEHYAQLIHLGLANDTKRLKNAELLIQHTTRRLGEYLHMASTEDRPTLQATLKHLDRVHDELLTQVFNH